MHTVQDYDLIVVGHGAAGLAAALTYAEAGEHTRIAVLERSSRAERGDATRWTGAFSRLTEDRAFDHEWPSCRQRVSGG
jgi:tricarballylate dehydrogenase